MNQFFDQLANFFAALTPEYKVLLAIIALFVFTIGLVLGWLIQKKVTRRFRQQLLLMRSERDTLQASQDRLQAESKTLGNELQLVSTEKVQALDRLQEADRELFNLRNQLEQVEATNQTYASTIESLNDQVIGLKTQNETLISSPNAGAAAGATDGEEAQSDGEWGLPPSTSVPNPEPAAAPGTVDEDQAPQPGSMSLEDRLQYLEDRLAGMAEQRELAARTGTPQPSNLYTVQQPSEALSDDDGGEPMVIRADTTEPGIRQGHDGEAEVVVQTNPSIQSPVVINQEESPRDDLTLISKVGPFLQSQLNNVDIYRFEQIASWSEADVITYTELIGYLPGVIQRDDWVGQARKLADNAEPVEAESSSEPDDTSTPTPNTADTNLRIVEGIGPRISALLAENGITTLGELADSTTDQLQSILDAAGGSFRFHDPKTWVAQAGLAADGKLDELKKWQDELKGGL